MVSCNLQGRIRWQTHLSVHLETSVSTSMEGLVGHPFKAEGLHLCSTQSLTKKGTESKGPSIGATHLLHMLDQMIQ